MSRHILHIFSFIFLLGACSLSDNNKNTIKPLSGKLVFSALDTSETDQIFTMQVDGSELKQLTFNKLNEGGAYNPAWSPDGQAIAYSSFKLGSTAGPALWLMNADGTNQRPVSYESGDLTALKGHNPAWSPDGSKIAFDYCVNCEIGGKNYEIFIVDLATDSVTQLTKHPVGDFHPTWNQDGTQIAFSSNRDYYDAEFQRYRKDLYTINNDGSNLQRLTNTGNATLPVWGPKDNRIAYVWRIHGNEVFIYHVSTGQIKNLKTGLEFSGSPMWSSIKNELLILGRETDQSLVEMRLLKLKGKRVKVLEKVAVDNSLPGTGYNWHHKKQN